MTRWFRHYAGMMRDEKLVRVAIRTKQSIERVAWVWGAILESASENDGSFDVDASEVAYFLRADESDVRAILGGLAEAGRVHDGVVCKWRERQFISDVSTERVRKHRAAKGTEAETVAETDETAVQRFGNPPETETETETETEKKKVERASAPSTPKRNPRLILETVLSPEMADAVLDHRQKLKKALSNYAAEALAKGFLATGDPEAAARMMIERGWIGFNLEWFNNANAGQQSQGRNRGGPGSSRSFATGILGLVQERPDDRHGRSDDLRGSGSEQPGSDYSGGSGKILEGCARAFG